MLPITSGIVPGLEGIQWVHSASADVLDDQLRRILKLNTPG